MTRLGNQILVVGFCAALAAPGAGWVLGEAGPTGMGELRTLAPPPRVSWSHLGGLPGAVERYVDDHFGFREQLIRWHHQFYYFGLGASPRPEVIRGKDGWLFLATGQSLALHRRTLPPLSTGLLRTWRRVLAERQAWMAERGGAVG